MHTVLCLGLRVSVKVSDLSISAGFASDLQVDTKIIFFFFILPRFHSNIEALTNAKMMLFIK